MISNEHLLHGSAIPCARQEVVVARDEALRSNEDMRVKLRNFEDTLQGVSQETLVVLEKKEAVLRRVQEERKEEREARERGTHCIGVVKSLILVQSHWSMTS